jgi:hypothetical protein
VSNDPTPTAGLITWDEIEAEHKALCHGDGSPCVDGCDASPDPEALAAYLAE